MNRHLPLAMLVVLTVFTYSSFLSSGYVSWDDNVFILENELLKLDFIAAAKIFFSRFFYGDYLPIPLMSYWIEIKLFGYNPAAQHATNLAIHLLNLTLVWKLLMRPRNFGLADITITPLAAFIICFVFAMHPLQVESVMWISERKGLLSLLFTLLSWLSWRRFAESNQRLMLVAFYSFFIVACMSKTNIVFFPFLLIIIDYFNKDSFRRLVKFHILTTIFIAIVIYVRFYAYADSISELGKSTINFERIISIPLLLFNALGLYIKKIFLPINLSIEYENFKYTFEIVLNLGILFSFAAVCVWLWLRTKEGLVVIATSFFFFMLLPVLQIVPRTNYVNDRYVYVPILAIAGLVALLISQFKIRKNILIALTIVYMVVTIPLSIIRVQVWTNSLELWTDTLSKNPLSAIAHLNYGLELKKEKKFSEAIEAYKKSAQLGLESGTSVIALNNLANVYLDKNAGAFYNVPFAVLTYQQAMSLAKSTNDWVICAFNLANLYHFLANMKLAIKLNNEILLRLSTTSDSRLDSIRAQAIANSERWSK